MAIEKEMIIMRSYTNLCLLALLVFILILPVSALPIVTGSGMSTYEENTLRILNAKDVWSSTDTGQDANIAAWIQIPPGSDATWTPASCAQSWSEGCYGDVNYFYQYRLITPDGKDWLKDILGSTSTYNVGNSQMVLSEPRFFRTVGTSKVDSIGGSLTSVGFLLPRTNPNKDYQWQGTWTVELYIHDTSVDPRQSTLVKTLTFQIVDGSSPAGSATLSAPVITVQPSVLQSGATSTTVPVSTTPVVSGNANSITINANDFVKADVQKTGASWDSTVETCPTWRGNDWSGTGDYYLSRGGDSLTYSFTVPSQGAYVLWMRDWSDNNHAKGERQVTVAIDGDNLNTVDAASAFTMGTAPGYGWDRVSPLPLLAGTHTMKVAKKDTTSSAVILDVFLLTPSSDIPSGPIGHSSALCAGGSSAAASTTTAANHPLNTYTSPICTPPSCPGGSYYCPTSSCDGGCGMICSGVAPEPTRSGMEIPLIMLGIGCAIIAFSAGRKR